MDIHRAKVLKQVKLIKDSSNDEDSNLSTSVEELQVTLFTLKGEYATLEAAQQRVHDPLQYMNVFDRLSCCVWASIRL